MENYNAKRIVAVMLAGLFALGLVFARLGIAGAADGKKNAVDLDKDPHLVGWWQMDDASGKTAADSSKHGRKGTLMGGLSFDNDSVAGRIGKALKLDGKDDVIEIKGYKGVTGTKPRTIAAWVKTDKGGGEIMHWGTDEPGKRWLFRIMRTGTWADPKGGYLYTNDKIHDDKWRHIALVVREAEQPTLHDHVTHYRDGEIPELHDIGLLHMYSIDTGNEMDVRIGRGFKGLLDDLRLYDRALSQDEIVALGKPKGRGGR